MASRRSPAQRLPDAVREAVESTVQATRESAQGTRGRAQEAVDDLVKAAEAGAEAVRDRVRDAGEGAEAVRERVRGTLEQRRPATSDDIREIKVELRAIARRLDAIEDRLPAKRAAAKPRGAAKKRGSGTSASAKRSSGRSQS
jgi:polyhydroxyalkanoate synthesis regulator phasin